MRESTISSRHAPRASPWMMSGAAESIVAKFGIFGGCCDSANPNPAWDLASEAADILSSEVRGHDFLPCPGSYKVIKLSERFLSVPLRLPVRPLSHKLCRVVIQWGEVLPPKDRFSSQKYLRHIYV